MPRVDVDSSTVIGLRRVPNRRLPSWLLIVIAIAGVGVDQSCKMVALAHLDPEHPLRFLGGWVRLQLTRNPGAAFSLGEGATAVFAVVAVLALVAIVVFALPRLATRLDGVIMAFLMAGIGGNLVDRLCRPPGFLHGYVIDFIWVSHFAIFNVADVFITCAAIAIGIRLVFFGGSMGVRTPAEASLAVDGSV